MWQLLRVSKRKNINIIKKGSRSHLFILCDSLSFTSRCAASFALFRPTCMPLFVHDASSFPPTSESCTTYICRVFFLQTSCFSFSSSIFLFLFFRKQDRGGVMKHILMNNSATTRLLSRPGQQLAHPVPTRVASCTTHAAVMVRMMDFTLSVHTLCGRMPTIPSSCPVFVHPSPPRTYRFSRVLQFAYRKLFEQLQ